MTLDVVEYGPYVGLVVGVRIRGSGLCRPSPLPCPSHELGVKWLTSRHVATLSGRIKGVMIRGFRAQLKKCQIQ